MLIQDTFTGTDGAAWDTNKWTTDSANGGTIDIASNEGRVALTVNASTARGRAIAKMTPAADTELLCSYRYDSTGAEGLSYCRFWLRSNGTWAATSQPVSGYGVELRSNSTSIYGQKSVAGTATQLTAVSGVSAISAGTKRWIRLRMQGTTLSARVWADGATEPSSWSAEWTGLTEVTGSGVEQTTIRLSSTATANNAWRIDDLSVTDLNATPAPVANFSADVTSGTLPLSVQFTDSSTNTPTAWSWNFGDGNTSTSQSPTHIYSSAGTYTVALTATNSGGSNTMTKASYITVNATSNGTIFADAYPQANASPWDSNKWTTDTDGGSAVVENGEGALKLNATASVRTRAIALMTPTTDTELLCSFRYDDTGGTARSYMRIQLKGSGDWVTTTNPTSGYAVEVRNDADNIEFTKTVGATSTILGSTTGSTVSTGKHWLRYRVEGGTLSAKVWLDGNTEPTSWMLQSTGQTEVTQPGVLQITTRTSATSSLANAWRIDDLSVTDLNYGKPTAVAGIDQTVSTGSLTTLDGSGSSDSNGTITSYSWSQVSGTTVTLTGTGATRTFTPTVADTYVFQLTVTDNDSLTATDTVTITASAAAETVFSDTYPQTNASPWDSTKWTTDTNGGSAVVENGEGALKLNAAASVRTRAISLMTPATDTELLFSFRYDDISSAAKAYLRVWVRSSGSWAATSQPPDGYGVEVRNDATSVELQKAVSSTATALASGVGPALSTTKRWMRLRMQGSTLSVKVWLDGDTEPGTWTIQDTTLTEVTAAGVLQFSARTSSTTTSANAWRIDDVAVTDLAANVPTVSSRWTGAVTPTSAKVTTKTTLATSVRLKISTTSDLLTSPVFTSPVTPDANGIAKHSITGLTTNTKYYYGVEMDTTTLIVSGGEFKTFPTGATSFTFAFSSCQGGTTTDPDTWDRILARNPLMFFHLGDFFYDDGGDSSAAGYRDEYDRKLNLSKTGNAFRKLPVAYTWSDHDYAMNADLSGSLITQTVRDNAKAVYEQYVPYWEKPDTNGGIYQTFVIGRVRFIITDNRSYMSSTTDTDNSSKTMLGTAQKQWFKNTITNATEALIIWANENPWIGAPGSGGDRWSSYSTERTELANFIAASGKNLAIISGDMHAIAADDGTNSPGGIVVLHAAALSNASSQKGGPYTQGPFPASGSTVVRQYGMLSITDTGGSSIGITYTGYDSSDVAQINLTKTYTVALAPVANFSANVTSGTSPVTVSFTDTSTNTPTSWLWNFGDGATSTSQHPSHIYTFNGTYEVTLTATNSTGSDVETKTAYITVTGGPTLLKKWSGDGLNAGTLTTTSAGTGDTPFDVLIGTGQSIVNTGTRSPRIELIQVASTACALRWDLTTQTQGAFRCYWTSPATWGSASFNIAGFHTSGSVPLQVNVMINGNLRIIAIGGAIIASSGAGVVQNSTRYRVEARVTHNGTSGFAEVALYSGESTVAVATISGVGDYGANHTRAIFGNYNTTPTVPTMQMDDFAVSDTASFIGPYGGGAGATWGSVNVTVWNGSSRLPATIKGVWNGSQIVPAAFKNIK